MESHACKKGSAMNAVARKVHHDEKKKKKKKKNKKKCVRRLELAKQRLRKSESQVAVPVVVALEGKM